MDAGKLRIVFVGMSSFFTRPVLAAVAKRHQLAGVVETRAPDAPDVDIKGNTHTLMGLFARHRRIPHFMLKPSGERASQFIHDLHPDVVCVAGCAMRLRREEFAIPTLGTINLHPSLLPKYRGPEPYFWQYHQMDFEGGISVHQMDDGIDTGDLLLQERFAIGLGEPFLSVFQRSVALGAAAVLRTIEMLAQGQARPREQRHLECPLYARFVMPGEQFVDWESWPIERIWHFLRGTHHRHPDFSPPFGLVEEWSIGEIERYGVTARRGDIAKDGRGYYLAHSEGKIRLVHHRRNPAYRAVLPSARRVRRMVEWW